MDTMTDTLATARYCWEEHGTDGLAELLESARRHGYSHVRNGSDQAWHAIDSVLEGLEFHASIAAIPERCCWPVRWRVTEEDGRDLLQAQPIGRWRDELEAVWLCNDLYLVASDQL